MGRLDKGPRGRPILSCAQFPQPAALAWTAPALRDLSEVAVPPADPEAEIPGQAVYWGDNLRKPWEERGEETGKKRQPIHSTLGYV